MAPNELVTGLESRGSFGRLVRDTRRRRGLSQAELAKALGVTPSLVSKLERGHMTPSPRVAERCKEVLGESNLAREVRSARVIDPAVHEGPDAPGQLTLGFSETQDWVADLLPKETLLSAGPPAVFHWDIDQTIRELAYLTHDYFRYYGKFPPTIPRKLLRDLRPRRGTWVLDNFAGSGTTAVESLCEGLPSVSVDISPLATLATRVKTTVLDERPIMHALEDVLRVAEVSRIRGDGPLPADPALLEQWFTPSAQQGLAAVRVGIREVKDDSIRAFLTVAFLAIIRRVSRAYDGEVRPHVNPDKKERPVHVAYRKKVLEMVQRMMALRREVSVTARTVAITGDNRQLTALADWSSHPVGLVISHPPYLNCFDYVPVYKLEYAWAQGLEDFGSGVDYRALRKSETRCWPATDERVFEGYFAGLSQAYKEVAEITQRGTRCCVVLGDCTIKGRVIPVLARFAESMAEIGFRLERTYLRSTHYGIGKYAYADRADYHGNEAKKNDGVLVFLRR